MKYLIVRICTLAMMLTLSLNLNSITLAQDVKPARAPINLEELDQRLADTFKASKIPGASVALIENDALVLSKGYGLADVANGKKVNAESVFRAGSISKSVLGIAVMLLVEDGKLDLNAKVADLVPEIRFTNPWEATDPLRVVHLLEHTTGFDALSFHQMRIAGPNLSLRQAIDLYGPYVSRWKPGTYFAYCDSAPVIAAYIVEKISGQKWAEFTRQRIFGPLGMESAYWDRSPAIVQRLAKSYNLNGVTEEPYVDIPGKPAGALNVSAQDLGKLIQLFIGRGTSNGVTILKPESIDRIETPTSTLAARAGLKTGYGLGNMATITEKSVFHGHNGSIDGFMAIYNYEPLHRAGFVVMINSLSNEALAASSIITAYLERTWAIPQSVLQPVPDSKSNLKINPTKLQAWGGFYDSIAPTAQWLAPLEQPIPTRVSIENGLLTFNSVQRKESAPGLFQRPDHAVANIVFVQSSDGPLMLSGSDARRRISSSELIAKVSYAAVWILALLSSLILILLWIIAVIRRRLRGFSALMVRFVPVAAMLLPVSFFICLVVGLIDPVTQFGTESQVARSLWVLSLLIPVGGAIALLVVWKFGREIRLSLRLFAWTNSLLNLTACIAFWHYGWLGLRIWL